MFGLFKRKNKIVFRIVYVLNAFVEKTAIHFDMKDIMVDYVKADDSIKAMVRFCLTHPTFSHVYIHECKEVKIV